MRNLSFVIWLLGWPGIFLYNPGPLLAADVTANTSTVLLLIWFFIWLGVAIDVYEKMPETEEDLNKKTNSEGG